MDSLLWASPGNGSGERSRHLHSLFGQQLTFIKSVDTAAQMTVQFGEATVYVHAITLNEGNMETVHTPILANTCWIHLRIRTRSCWSIRVTQMRLKNPQRRHARGGSGAS